MHGTVMNSPYYLPLIEWLRKCEFSLRTAVCINHIHGSARYGDFHSVVVGSCTMMTYIILTAEVCKAENIANSIIYVSFFILTVCVCVYMGGNYSLQGACLNVHIGSCHIHICVIRPINEFTYLLSSFCFRCS
jgi:hypothetical protein